MRKSKHVYLHLVMKISNQAMLNTNKVSTKTKKGKVYAEFPKAFTWKSVKYS